MLSKRLLGLYILIGVVSLSCLVVLQPMLRGGFSSSPPNANDKLPVPTDSTPLDQQKPAEGGARNDPFKIPSGPPEGKKFDGTPWPKQGDKRENTLPEPVHLKDHGSGGFIETDYIHRAKVITMKSPNATRLESFTYVQTITNYVCDQKCTGRCDIRLEKDYNYLSLGNKTKDALDNMCQQPEYLPELLVKIDDDIIIEKEELNMILGDAVHSKCIYIGLITSNKRPFYWGGGGMYILKREALKMICARDRTLVGPLRYQEDVFIGHMLNLTDSTLACSLEGYMLWHNRYKDERLNIRYDKNR